MTPLQTSTGVLPGTDRDGRRSGVLPGADWEGRRVSRADWERRPSGRRLERRLIGAVFRIYNRPKNTGRVQHAPSMGGQESPPSVDRNARPRIDSF